VSNRAVNLGDLSRAPVAPWRLDEDGSLAAPPADLRTMPALAHA
jgi:hypothetical protein